MSGSLIAARETFTREEILVALTLNPCHVTGMHTPGHHVAHRSSYDGSEQEGRVCDSMRAKGYARLLALIGATEDELPHALHDECGWCHRVPTQEKYRVTLRRSYEWAGVPIPSELAAEGSPT